VNVTSQIHMLVSRRFRRFRESEYERTILKKYFIRRNCSSLNGYNYLYKIKLKLNRDLPFQSSFYWIITRVFFLSNIFLVFYNIIFSSFKFGMNSKEHLLK